MKQLRSLEQGKPNALRISKWCFDAMRIFSLQSLTDIQWWYNTKVLPKITLRKTILLLKLHLMQVVLGGELSATILALEEHIILTKRNIILILWKFWLQNFLWKYLEKYLIHILSSYKTTTTLNGINNMHSNEPELLFHYIWDLGLG